VQCLFFYPRIEAFEICILLQLGKHELKKHLHYFNIFILDGWEVTTIIVFFWHKLIHSVQHLV
jgi:hypothetical protein